MTLCLPHLHHWWHLQHLPEIVGEICGGVKDEYGAAGAGCCQHPGGESLVPSVQHSHAPSNVLLHPPQPPYTLFGGEGVGGVVFEHQHAKV